MNSICLHCFAVMHVTHLWDSWSMRRHCVPISRSSRTMDVCSIFRRIIMVISYSVCSGKRTSEFISKRIFWGIGKLGLVFDLDNTLMEVQVFSILQDSKRNDLRCIRGRFSTEFRTCREGGSWSIIGIWSASTTIPPHRTSDHSEATHYSNSEQNSQSTSICRCTQFPFHTERNSQNGVREYAVE